MEAHDDPRTTEGICRGCGDRGPSGQTTCRRDGVDPVGVGVRAVAAADRPDDRLPPGHPLRLVLRWFLPALADADRGGPRDPRGAAPGRPHRLAPTDQSIRLGLVPARSGTGGPWRRLRLPALGLACGADDPAVRVRGGLARDRDGHPGLGAGPAGAGAVPGRAAPVAALATGGLGDRGRLCGLDAVDRGRARPDDRRHPEPVQLALAVRHARRADPVVGHQAGMASPAADRGGCPVAAGPAAAGTGTPTPAGQVAGLCGRPPDRGLGGPAHLAPDRAGERHPLWHPTG